MPVGKAQSQCVVMYWQAVSSAATVVGSLRLTEQPMPIVNAHSKCNKLLIPRVPLPHAYPPSSDAPQTMQGDLDKCPAISVTERSPTYVGAREVQLATAHRYVTDTRVNRAGCQYSTRSMVQCFGVPS